ncbi:hypothetical protein DQW50_08080 [Halorubrum sp. 48-1-W]|uniref:DUF7551 domain-containing protein n=1 Tax=Halorubrum sp. 48-1-W TaxID=2249761 RepID=UPI000DCD40A3|nr:hypothetical protein [Halorubrum sp. 48-1-W]RAW45693.1 hypothetical protein DQW50_08080 [Halorubrum sp. 48-1-W]
MIGTTLEEVRDHIERLATAEGDYYLVCARYGDRPVPAAGLRFEDRSTGRAAVRATEQYRAALRRYDPAVPRYDVIVCQLCDRPGRSVDPTPRPEGSRTRRTDGHVVDEERWTLSEPVINGRGRRNERRRLVEFCHRIAAAVFEALSEAGWRDVETAVLDRYFELAESVPDPDDLCLCLLEGMAAELADRLAAGDQLDVLSRAADRLGDPSIDAFDDTDGGAARLDDAPGADDGDTATRFSGTLGDLHKHGLLEGFTHDSAVSEDAVLGAGIDSFVESARITGYALSPRNGALPVLPIVVEFLRRSPERRSIGVRVESTDGGWTVRVAFDGDPRGLAVSPIDSSGT